LRDSVLVAPTQLADTTFLLVLMLDDQTFTAMIISLLVCVQAEPIQLDAVIIFLEDLPVIVIQLHVTIRS